MKSNVQKGGNLPLQELVDAIQKKDPMIAYGDIAEKIGRSLSSLSRSLRLEREGTPATPTLLNLVRSKYEVLLTGKKTHMINARDELRDLHEALIRQELWNEIFLYEFSKGRRNPAAWREAVTKKHQAEVERRLDGVQS